MSTTGERLGVLKNHACTTTTALTGSPKIVVTPRTSLINDQVRIQLHGLEPNQIVRLVAKLVENNVKFESNAVYRASPAGDLDLDRHASLAGTYTGVDPMGLFWSLAPCPGQGKGIRLVKKDVTIPKCYNIQAVRETSEDTAVKLNEVIAETTVEKLYLKNGVKRIPVTEGKLRGTLFIPEGSGPFPGLIDMFGGLVSLVETRAALLASHGFASFALVYMYQDDLAQQVSDVDIRYIQFANGYPLANSTTDTYKLSNILARKQMNMKPSFQSMSATEWFSTQPYVDTNRVGAIGLCIGGSLSLLLAATTPRVKAVVNINGTSIMSGYDTKLHVACSTGNPWPNPHAIYRTKDGIIIRDMWDCVNPKPIPAWQHGAKILFIVGEDDAQVHPKMHHFCRENWPSGFKQNFEMNSYAGTGHLIEPPYSPHCKVVNPTKRRIASVNIIPDKYHDELMVAGGNPRQHGFAQIDAWKKIIDFLQRKL